MSTFDALPPKVREWLRRHRPGQKILVPKELTAHERHERARHMAEIHAADLAAGVPVPRSLDALAARFGLSREYVREAVSRLCVEDRGPET